jgi:tetratricopeptide (TPR) repeat protein
VNFRIFLMGLVVLSLLVFPVFATDSPDQLNSAGALYSKSVDLANAGNYTEALQASDQALALNVTSLVPVIQANRAGILVMLGRYEEAITAADVTLNAEGNLTTAYSIAWYNKGNALRSLGKLDEARTAYANAYALDKSLVPPDMTGPATSATATRSPLPVMLVPVGIGLLVIIRGLNRSGK